MFCDFKPALIQLEAEYLYATRSHYWEFKKIIFPWKIPTRPKLTLRINFVSKYTQTGREGDEIEENKLQAQFSPTLGTVFYFF